MVQNTFLLEYFKTIWYLYQLKNELYYFSGTTRIDWWKTNGMPDEYIEIITKSDSNFTQTFVDHHVLNKF